MTKKILFFITVIALIAISATAVAIKTVPNLDNLKSNTNSKAEDIEKTNENDSEETWELDELNKSNVLQEQQNLVKKSFDELIDLSSTLTCKSETKNGEESVIGNIYVTKGKLRATFNITDSNGKEFQSNALKLENILYVWDGTNKTGLKINLEDSEDITSIESLANMPADLFYNCETKAFDSSEFDIPQDITFQNFTLDLDTLLDKEALCSYCDQAADSNAINECKSRLNCN